MSEAGYASGFSETTVDKLFEDAATLAVSRKAIKKTA